MSFLIANCPSCAGQIEFKSGSSIVAICPYCRSAVARKDRALEDLGKVAEIFDTNSPLKLGLKGQFKGVSFELTGRAQLKHELGGTWDEWYATFSNGWVGWLAEAQGRFYLTFYQKVPKETPLPAFEELALGSPVTQIPNSSPLIVAEKGIATTIAGDGEIPYKLIPNEKNSYADLSGQNKAFGTIDYGMNPPWVFVGQQVDLGEIGLASAKPKERTAKTVSALAMPCPKCGGPLELNAPDLTERVVCPYCSSYLDVNEGNLKYLRSSNQSGEPQFVFKLGEVGKFGDDQVDFKIIGAMVRSVTIEGIKYFWHEYLLYNAMVGFRWLVNSDDHWNFVEPVNPGDVDDGGLLGIKYNGSRFKIFQDAQAKVEYVTGEFYWKVETGETVRSIDYVSAPVMLSKEVSSSEINWSAGVYMPVAQIEKAFERDSLTKPSNIAPNQPFGASFYYTWGALPLVALVLVSMFLTVFSGASSSVITQNVTLPPMTSATAPQTVFSLPFDVRANQNVSIEANVAKISNSYIDLDVDLINEQSQEVESVNIPIEYYFGTDSDGSWTEGSKSKDVVMSSLPAGKYTLRIEGTWQDWQQQMPVNVVVKQNVINGTNMLCAFLTLVLIPGLGIIRKWMFESAKWRESMFSTSSDE